MHLTWFKNNNKNRNTQKNPESDLHRKWQLNLELPLIDIFSKYLLIFK